MPTTKTVNLYNSIAAGAPVFASVSVTTGELPNLVAAIESGAWYVNPAYPNDHWHMAGVARYQVKS